MGAGASILEADGFREQGFSEEQIEFLKKKFKESAGAKDESNIILLTDSYKVSHHVQYPKNTTKVYSYFESRGGKHKNIVFYGLQYILKKYLSGVVVTRAKIEEAEKMYAGHFGATTNLFNKEGWEHILEKHGGKLPVRIRAVPEGTVLPTKNCCITVENTDPKCWWLPNFLETVLVQVWYPMTVATNSREQKRVILENLIETGDPSEANVMFKLHDFGFRGVSSIETAGIGASAHLTQFAGTDTVAGLVVARDYYGKKDGPAGFSIPASEHSTITSWGRDREIDAFRNMLTKYPKGLVACVSDSYDIFKACSDLWGTELKDMIMSRDGTLVVRPDSGDPKTIDLKILELLGEKFGTTKNEKGFKELPPQVRIIQGDGIKYETLIEILDHLKKNGWSGNNIAFGSGGGLLQKLDRDTQKCAFKCSLAIVDGKEIEVYKDPVTAPGKKSKRGYMTVNRGDDGVIRTKCGDQRDEKTDILELVFENGEIIKEYEWEAVKKRAALTADMITPKDVASKE